MLNCFLSLRHHPIISGNNENHYVRRRSTPCSHRCEGRAPRCIDKANFTMIGGYTVGTNVLSNSSSLPTCHLGVSNIVKEGCLTVIDVPHHRHHRRTRFGLSVVYQSLFQFCFNTVSVDQFDLMTKLFNHQCSCFLVNGSIHISHYPEPHQRLHHFCRLNGHFLGKLLHCNGLCQFNFAHNILSWCLKFVSLVRFWYC